MLSTKYFHITLVVFVILYSCSVNATVVADDDISHLVKPPYPFIFSGIFNRRQMIKTEASRRQKRAVAAPRKMTIEEFITLLLNCRALFMLEQDPVRKAQLGTVLKQALSAIRHRLDRLWTREQLDALERSFYS